MAIPRGKKDWWDTFLYVGVFILILLFLYELLKLWQAGTTKALGVLGSISTALTNTLAAVENGLSNLVVNPIATLSNLFSGFPSLISLGFSFLDYVLTGGVFNWLGSIFNDVFGTTAPTTTGLGSSYLGTLPGISTGAPTVPVTNADFSYNQSESQ